MNPARELLQEHLRLKTSSSTRHTHTTSGNAELESFFQSLHVFCSDYWIIISIHMDYWLWYYSFCHIQTPQELQEYLFGRKLLHQPDMLNPEFHNFFPQCSHVLWIGLLNHHFNSYARTATAWSLTVLTYEPLRNSERTFGRKPLHQPDMQNWEFHNLSNFSPASVQPSISQQICRRLESDKWEPAQELHRYQTDCPFHVQRKFDSTV